MKVLVIDDDRELADYLRAHLPREGFATDVAYTAAAGIESASVTDYDLVLLDLQLPDLPGERVIEKLHTRTRIPPILVLTVVGDAASKIRMLNSGADDYLAKPFLFDELVARMRALVRRSVTVTPDVLSTAGIVLSVHQKEVTRGKQTIPLTRTELAILEYLMRHRESVVSRSALIEHVWDSSTNPFSSSIDTHLSNLRKKLGKPEVIETVHNEGYRILSA